MSRLFISHSSQNNAEAAALNLWLREQGWDDVFLDVTPDRGIAAGERWERALNEAASRCEAVLFLVSRGWIASRWCRKEYELARRLNKRLLGALVEVIPVNELPEEVTDTFQMVDLASGQDHRMVRAVLPRTHEEVHVTFSEEGLARLKGGLGKAGLDPRFFAWPPDNDPNRAPYRGLKPLEAEDSGIFFGREAPIIEGLDALRGLAEAAAPRLFVILGASGAGKSSYLRAGLLPRLARDDRTFLTLPVIRPEGGAVSGETGLVAALEGALSARRIPQSRAAIRQSVAGGGATLKPLLGQLAAKAFAAVLSDEGAQKPPAVTIAIDQAEELFTDGEGEALLGLVRDLVELDGPAVIVLFTIRSDSYDALETAKALEGLRQRTLPLLPMPRGAFQTVIEGPAARLAGTGRPLSIEPRLTQRLLEDIEKGGGSDALPLLAFTLGQLYVDFGGSGSLTLADYEAFGGIQGAIEAAVRRVMQAADREPRIPRDPEARLLLLRRGLIPWLAGIDPDTGSPRRRLARFADIPADAEPLVRLLVDQRLLSLDRVAVRDGEGERQEVTVEPAHEALLRQWGLLRGWLHEDFGALAVLDAAKRAARDWDANARGDDWLNHTGTRLAEAETVAARPDLGASLGPGGAEYLGRCRARDDAEERARAAKLEQERQLKDSQVRLARADQEAAEARTAAARRFTRLAVGATAAVALVLLAAGGLGALSYFQARERDDALAAAEAGRWVAKSQGELRADDAVEAVRSAYRAYRDRPREETRSALLTALLAIPDLAGTFTVPGGGSAQALAWLGPDTVGFASQAATLRALTVPGGRAAEPWPSPPIEDVQKGFAIVRALRQTGPDRITAALSDGGIVTWGRDGRLVTALPSGDGVVDGAAIGGTGVRIAQATGEAAVLVTCGRDPAQPGCTPSRVAETPTRAVAIDERETTVVTGDATRTVTAFDPAGLPRGEPMAVADTIHALAAGDGGDLLAAGLEGGAVALLAPGRGQLQGWQDGARPITALAFRPAVADGVELAGSCGESAACLWRFTRSQDGVLAFAGRLRLPGRKGVATGLDWSRDGSRLAARYADGVVRVWAPDATGPLGAGPVGRTVRLDGTAEVRRGVLSPAGDRLAAAAGATVHVLDPGTGRVLLRLTRPDGLELRSLAWAPDGRIAAVTGDGTVAVWPRDGGEPAIRRWDAAANPGLAWVAGGRLAVALSDGRVVLFDPARRDGEEVLPAIGPGADPWGLAASPDGAALYASYVGGEIWRWDVAAKSYTVLRAGGPDRPVAERGGPEGLSVSPDGRWLAATADDGGVRLFETAGPGRRTLPTESADTRSVSFSPDGRRLAASGGDGRVTVWTGMEAEPVRFAAFQPASGSERTVGTWLAWAGPTTLLVSLNTGAIQTVTLDEAAWRQRAENLDLQLGTAR